MVETALQTSRDAAKAAKSAYDTAVSSRATAQHNVNSLLERKHAWTDADVSTFTTLIRSDHASNHAVSSTSQSLDAAELAVDRAFSDLTQAILRRYHEEQVWSDKIRSFSTWASIAGFALNFVVFVGAIAFVEPWKRRRLAEGIEARMGRMMESVEGRIDALAASVGASEGASVSEGPSLRGVGTEGASDSNSSLEGANVQLEFDGKQLELDGTSAADWRKGDLVGSASPRDPWIQTPIPILLEHLPALATPSHERDLAAAATTGAVVGVGLLSIIQSLRR